MEVPSDFTVEQAMNLLRMNERFHSFLDVSEFVLSDATATDAVPTLSTDVAFCMIELFQCKIYKRFHPSDFIREIGTSDTVIVYQQPRPSQPQFLELDPRVLVSLDGVEEQLAPTPPLSAPEYVEIFLFLHESFNDLYSAANSKHRLLRDFQEPVIMRIPSVMEVDALHELIRADLRFSFELKFF